MPVERRGIRALQIWCQRVTEGYDNVNVTDMSTSFRDGLAVCAIIHHFRPTLIDFASLSPDDVYKNNELAFSVAEEHLGIPTLLDPQDLVDGEVPDKFSVITYVSQFYHLLKHEDGSCSPSLARSKNNSECESAGSSRDVTPIGTPSSTPKFGGGKSIPCQPSKLVTAAGEPGRFSDKKAVPGTGGAVQEIVRSAERGRSQSEKEDRLGSSNPPIIISPTLAMCQEFDKSMKIKCDN